MELGDQEPGQGVQILFRVYGKSLGSLKLGGVGKRGGGRRRGGGEG